MQLFGKAGIRSCKGHRSVNPHTHCVAGYWPDFKPASRMSAKCTFVLPT